MPEDNNVVQFIVVILIGALYAVSAIVKKANTWINQQRMRRPAEEKTPPSPAERRTERPFAQAERPTERPVRQPEPAARPAAKDPRTVLLRELAKALTGGLEMNEEGPSVFQPQPAARPQPESRAPSVPRPVPIPVAATGRPQSPHKMRESRMAADGAHRAASDVRIHEAARVRHRRMGHLAVLRSPQDIQRGILVHEILGPPRAHRPFRPAEARSRRV